MRTAVNRTPPPGVDQWLRAPAAWLFPLRCVVCGEPGHDGRDLCAACAADLPWQGPACRRCALPLPVAGICGACVQAPPPLDAVHAVFDYRFPLDRLLPRLKFHEDLASGRVLARCMAERCAALPRPDALVPIPLHWRRLQQRGYDQALELATPLARELGMRLRGDVLHRHRTTSAQSRLGAGARRRNLRAAFALAPAPAADPLPAHVALVDDVMTTGATLHAAALALRRGGVTRVDAWICARVA